MTAKEGYSFQARCKWSVKMKVCILVCDSNYLSLSLHSDPLYNNVQYVRIDEGGKYLWEMPFS